MASKFRLRKTINALNNVIKQLEENQLSYLKAKTASQGKIFAFYHHGGGTNVGCDSEVTVPYNSLNEVSDSTHFSNSGGEITFNVGGIYEIVYTVNTNCSSGSSRSSSRAEMQKYSGGSWSTVAGSEAFMYNRLAGVGWNTCTSSFILTMNAGEKLRVRCGRNAGSDSIVIDAGGSAITIASL